MSSKKKFYGTGLSGEHIGNDESRRAFALLSKAGQRPCKLSAQAGAEDTNAILIDLQLKDLDLSEDYANAATVICRAYDANGAPYTNQATIRLSEEGAGSGVSTTAYGQLIITLSATGAAQLKVLDNTGSLSAVVYIELEIVGLIAPKELITLTFA